PGGSMTGGSVSRTAGILSRQGELERLREQESGLRNALASSGKELEDARREAAAAQYEMDTARAQQRQHEDDILKLDERVRHLAEQLADQQLRRDGLKEELEQLSRRAERTEADTTNARRRIEALEGSAAALRAEAEGKARGQGELREKGENIGTRMAGLNARKAALEAEKQAIRQALGELEDLRADLVGDRADRVRRIEELNDRNRELSGQIQIREERLQTIRAESSAQQAEIARLNQEKLELEGRRNQADKASRDKNSELLAMEREVSVLEQKKTAAQMEEKQLLDKLWESYELTHEAARAQRVELESVARAQRRVAELRKSISALGNINLDAIEEFARINERYTYFTDQRDDVRKAKIELEKIITGLTGEMERIFAQQFSKINEAFQQTFQELFGGGKATLELDDPEDILNCGIEIRVQPPGKTLKVITLLSGGEKAFVAIALYFAILKVRPTPFVVMDEIEAALDDANVGRFARYLRQMCAHTQFIVITHRRGTMEESDVLYGVTMQEQGVSRILTIDLSSMEKELEIQ
ncbi:MAG: chromosome segregation protein SMC, partial [Pseudoflavonifractor sp.]|nr:chromosome segregation protein SMC [Pseudoflavonifractor sp.]